MRISFYEEFPTEENLKKAELLETSARLILGARTHDDFIRAAKLAESYAPKGSESIWWPVLSEQEGYWFSAFSKPDAVAGAISDIEKHSPITVMWDAEPPLLRKSLFIRNMVSFFGTRKLIRDFIRDSESKGITVLTSELPLINPVTRAFLHFIGIAFPKGYPHARIIMAYQSFMPRRMRKAFLHKVLKKTKAFKRPWIVGLGVITEGILGNEKILPPEDLDEALRMCKGIDEVVIFRLGGLDERYAEVIRKHA